ncbi:hypothetical protein EUTSA_v10020566mg [Eutrema salsugineum]|uniref:H15 domain-containing protein n=1 Tax=Eutrema salsugineum TaxID=72664 RepID=V4LCG4_EUTSA|nr:histone H1 [Eutrema salsugineum]ESQ48115.1 hypothetical protein EUTSA_v10020566mg [Eutrema salsugineum]
MDPSLSISSDHHHPPQFTPFHPYPTSNNPFVSAPNPNHPLFAGQSVNQNPYNNHVFQPQPPPQPQTQTPPSQGAPLPPHPSLNHPPYSQMICAAIGALNEPDGSSKMAISRYIERFQPVLPPSHGALLTHHLKTLKNSGVLAMVKKSYKLAGSSPPPVSAVAASGLEVPRSETPPSNTGPLPFDPVAVSASGSVSQPLKRGRGRPPKPKPEGQQQPSVVAQPNTSQSNGLPSLEQQQHELPVTNPTEVGSESAKRRPGRPRKNGAAPIVQAAVMAGIMKRRGRPPGRRATGRQRKPKSVSATASVFPYVANGARRRGRPRRVDSSGGIAAAPAGGEVVAVAPGMKRGRGRPPKIGGVMNRLITKPKRGRGRPVGRPRKNTTWPVTGATGTQEPAYGELKRKLDFFKEKAKEILNVLKAGVTSSDNHAVVQAMEELEGLIPMLTVEPQAMEEVQPEEAAPQPETQTEAETQGEELGQEREGGGGEQAQTQTQTEAEAMQEALF